MSSNKRNPLVFYVENYVTAEEMIHIREELIRQIDEGVVVLPSNIKLISHPGMSELAEAAKDGTLWEVVRK